MERGLRSLVRKVNGVYRVTRRGAKGSEKTLEAKLIIQTLDVASLHSSLWAGNWKATFLEDDERSARKRE